jgi:hypothetical protein
MAGKIPLKTTLIIFLFYGIFIILSACVIPVDMDAFFNDEDVGNFTNKVNKPANPQPPEEKNIVKVDDKTGDGLEGDNEKITGLKNNKYYMVEKEVDSDGNPVTSTPRYVTDSEAVGQGGELWDFELITKIKDGSINGLKNLNTYTVRAAEPFHNGIIKYFRDNGEEEYKQVVNGSINISNTGYLDLSSVLLDGTYKVNAVYADNLTPWWVWSESETSNKWNKFKLEGPDKNRDIEYIFVNTTDFSDFKVLRVNIVPAIINIASIQGVDMPVTGGTPVSVITETEQYTGSVTWSPSVTGTFAASTSYTATITLTQKPGYTLQGVKENFFTVMGASTVTNAANTGVITAVFPATTSGFIIILTQPTDLIGAPAISGPSLIRDKLDGTKSIDLTLADPSDGGSWDVNSIVWSINPEVDTAAGLSSIHAVKLTITNGGNYSSLLAGTGETSFIVSVSAKKGGITYSAFVSVKVTGALTK